MSALTDMVRSVLLTKYSIMDSEVPSTLTFFLIFFWMLDCLTFLMIGFFLCVCFAFVRQKLCPEEQVRTSSSPWTRQVKFQRSGIKSIQKQCDSGLCGHTV